MKRILNIIQRAVNEFGMEINMNDSLSDIFAQAQDIILESDDDFFISECYSDSHFSHVSWSDGNGYDYEADGQFISAEERNNTYYRKEGSGFRKVEWYEHTDSDYVLMDRVIDSDAHPVLLVCKLSGK